ncbi:MAG: hydroxyethylthiazole kinase [Clostridiales bacterium]|nr:hydroxyethylthiazole kinase [Clostridiales bacterium]
MNDIKQGAANLINKVRGESPLVHHITNYVTANDCANMTLSIGGSPIMADAKEEVADIARIASSVVINIGTLNERTIPSMIMAGKVANESGIPVVFDPVGAGASRLRNDTADRIVDEINITVLRGNISEVTYLTGKKAQTKGVDASEHDMQNMSGTVAIAKLLATELECVVAITGAVDIVSDGERTICIKNGNPTLSNITGTGCMCSSLIGAFCGAAPNMPLIATVAALLTMGIAGEIAFSKAGQLGNGSFRTALHDAVSKIDTDTLMRRAKIYEA